MNEIEIDGLVINRSNSYDDKNEIKHSFVYIPTKDGTGNIFLKVLDDEKILIRMEKHIKDKNEIIPIEFEILKKDLFAGIETLK